VRILALGLLLGAALAGCGYRTGMVLTDTGETVGVEFFANDSKVPDLERELHGYVTDALNRMVHAPLVAPNRADLVVSGRVVDYSRRGGIRSVENELLEMSVRMTIEARLVRRSRDADGTRREEVVATNTFGSDSGFRVEEGEGELDARDRVLRNIADRIVLDLIGSLVYETAP
jgi:hypothetical protein